MRRKLLIGNWKMNSSLAANTILLNGIKSGVATAHCDLAVCVPAPYFSQCQAELTGTQVAWGAQDVSTHDIGPYTGEVSVTMLRDFGCRYTIVGHSERRMNHGETDQIVAEKARRALSNGIHPIICVGETLTQRESGQTADVVGGQLDTVLSVLEPDDLWNIVIAYEPVWAIGTGKTATPQMAQEVHALLRSKVAARNAAAANSVPILYGGSLRPDNAREMLSMHDIDGGLVGGASLNASDFMAIANAVS